MGGTASSKQDRRADEQILLACPGPTIDLGCGPGRFTAELASRDTPALGVDMSAMAVEMTLRRGGVAIQEDIFMPLPHSGRWQQVLLADGNIGIGGDPVRVLRRARELLAPHGVVVAEMDAPGFGVRHEIVRCETAQAVGDWFPWARVSASAAVDLANAVGLRVVNIVEVAQRNIVEMATT
ncbi:methyltransferase domain-containing protein [Antrihabitans cavernicola]|uniref:Methyltransferase domain-containing protein n=1 Tax=Antrihabitans cavernicola TaxID=2495913 RepID=A0A5A7SIJ4_9NOCA|nr:methyltransferase domain-containing protein [Spelaeibacter cavernicola]KAA0024305.1 methyltransferase domain-containing protein [Spelaeibacter cavernicola]